MPKDGRSYYLVDGRGEISTSLSSTWLDSMPEHPLGIPGGHQEVKLPAGRRRETTKIHLEAYYPFLGYEEHDRVLRIPHIYVSAF